MAPLLAILSIVSVFHPLPNTIVVYLKASNRTRPPLVLQIIHLVSVLILVASLAQYSVAAAAAGAVLAAALRLVVSAWMVVRADGVPAREFVWATLPMFGAALAMATAVYGLDAALGHAPAGVALIAEVLFGALVYVLAAFALCPAVASDFIALIKKSASRS
jgi:hypothetical protein